MLPDHAQATTGKKKPKFTPQNTTDPHTHNEERKETPQNAAQANPEPNLRNEHCLQRHPVRSSELNGGLPDNRFTLPSSRTDHIFCFLFFEQLLRDQCQVFKSLTHAKQEKLWERLSGSTGSNWTSARKSLLRWSTCTGTTSGGSNGANRILPSTACSASLRSSGGPCPRSWLMRGSSLHPTPHFIS